MAFLSHVLLFKIQYRYMKGKKLILLLQSLEAEEFKRFQIFIQSPFHNSNKRLLQVYKLLKASYPHFEGKALTDESLFSKLFPKETFNDYKLRRVLSQFTKLLEHYLLQLELEQQTFAARKLYVKALSRRDTYPQFVKEVQELKQQLVQEDFRDEENYFEGIQLDYLYYNHPLTEKYTLADSSLDRMYKELDYCYVLAKYKYGIGLKNRDRILRKKSEMPLQPLVASIAKEDALATNQLFSIYQLVWSLLETSDETTFYALKNAFFPIMGALSRDDQRNIFLSGLNFTNRQINKGAQGFHKESLDWYKVGLEHDLIIENNKMTGVSFNNICLLGCIVKDFAWTRQFIEQYQVFLDPSIKKDAMTANLGVWYFHQKDFKNTISTLYNHNFSKVYQLRTRIIIIRATFEQLLRRMDVYDFLISQIEAFEKFVSRDRLYTPERVNSQLNTVELLKASARKLRQGVAKREVSSWMTKELNQDKKFTAKTWLREKVQTLEG